MKRLAYDVAVAGEDVCDFSARMTNDLRSPLEAAGVDPQQSSRFPMGEDVTERFQMHKVEDEHTLHFMSLMRRTYAEAAREITTRLEPSREVSLALTKLVEASFWTSAAIARACGEPVGYGDPYDSSPVDERQEPSQDAGVADHELAGKRVRELLHIRSHLDTARVMLRGGIATCDKAELSKGLGHMVDVMEAIDAAVEEA